ncbi:MAG: 2-oxoacid:ferredoxin oxidoreductase subunit beta [Rhodospirillales bacterium]|jgi:2-oxoglutarate ferredoxin oxidoreductase subunit beta
MNVVTPAEPLKAKDFATDQEVRWCPGCGDYAILKAVQRTLAEIGASRENTVFVSGIGCAARFPYYIETYGFHTIHGRAPAFASGIKLTNPDLDVWIATGDGDALSIGGNHMLHVLRRNIDVQILMFNNEIYGLTKGQYSPTSRKGTRSPSTPQGSLEAPVKAAAFALGSGARFVARGIDTQQKQLVEVFKRAHDHKGASFVEIFQNCIVYNDGVYSNFTEKTVAADHQILVEHGKPLVFGKDNDKGLRVKPGSFELEVVTVDSDAADSDILIHDETNLGLAMMLAHMEPPTMPVPIGVLYCNPEASYEQSVDDQIEQLKKDKPAGSLNELLRGGYTWTVS